MMTPEMPPQRYANFDVKMEWGVSVKDRKTVIEGHIRNIRYARMENIEVWVQYRDAQGKNVARAVDLVMPRQLELNAAAPFRVALPTVVPPGGRLVFTYKYNGDDGGDASGWMQSFDSSMV